MKNTKRKGFTLIELVIVVAIIGILALMIIPQFNSVTKDAQLKTWQANCKTVVSAWAMYQAANKGTAPTSAGDLKAYINGGFPQNDNPPGSTYTLANGVFTATYTDQSDFVYPEQ